MRLIEEEDSLGNVTQFVYNSDNDVTMTIGPTTVTAGGYDLADRVVSWSNANGTTHYGYDPNGNQILLTDALGHKTSTTYDGAGRTLTQTSTTAAGTAVTTQAYTADGVLQQVVDADGNKTTFNINAADQETSGIAPNGSVETMRYDSNGNVISTTDQDGRTINYTYNGAGQLTSEVWIAADGHTITNSFSFVYDAAGQLLGATNSAGTYVFSYLTRARWRACRSRLERAWTSV